MSDKICFHSESEILHLNSQGQVDSAQGARRRQAALRDGAQQAGTDFNTELLNAPVLDCANCTCLPGLDQWGTLKMI